MSQTDDTDLLRIEPLIREVKRRQNRLREVYVNTDELSMVQQDHNSMSK